MELHVKTFILKSYIMENVILVFKNYNANLLKVKLNVFCVLGYLIEDAISVAIIGNILLNYVSKQSIVNNTFLNINYFKSLWIHAKLQEFMCKEYKEDLIYRNAMTHENSSKFFMRLRSRIGLILCINVLSKTYLHFL